MFRFPLPVFRRLSSQIKIRTIEKRFPGRPFRLPRIWPVVFVGLLPGGGSGFALEGGWWPEQAAPAEVISIPQPSAPGERVLLESLAGLLARAVNEGRGDSLLWIERSVHYRDWREETIQRLGASERSLANTYGLLRESIRNGLVEGYVVYELGSPDPDAPLDHSLNIATMLAGVLNAVIVEKSLVSSLPAGLDELADARTLTYEEVWETYADEFAPNLLFALSPANDARVERMRDFVVAHRGRTTYGVNDSTASAMLETSVPGTVFGWNEGGEFGHISQASRHGLLNTVSDWLANVTVTSAGSRDYEVAAVSTLDPATIDWTDERTPVSFVMSDGDNTGWVARGFWGPSSGPSNNLYWDHPEHGDFPIGFTVATTDLVDFAPVVIDRLAETKPEHTTVIHFSAYYYPDLFAINREGREEALRELARTKARKMKETGAITMTFIAEDTASAASLEAMQIFAEEIQPLLGMLVMDYDPYNAKQGEIFWIPDGNGGEVPAITPRYALWHELNRANSGSPEEVASLINADHEEFTAAWGAVHAWSAFPRSGDDSRNPETDQGVPAVRRAVNAINPDKAKVASPEEMLWRLRVAHDRQAAESLNEEIHNLPPGSSPTLGKANILFDSNFEPDGQVEFSPDNRPTGWGGDTTSSYPVRRWSNAPERAPQESNGYFGEIVRKHGDSTAAWEMSSRFIVPHEQEYEISFDFKANTDPTANNGETTGNVVFKFRQHDPFQGNVALHLYDGSTQTTIGDDNWKEGDFNRIHVTDPDTHGWRSITVTGTTTGQGHDADLWFTGTSGSDEPFTGSFGIDNVTVKDGVEVSTGIQSWRLTHFGTTANVGDAANSADPDGDGVPNLLEYALGRNPVTPSKQTPVKLGQKDGFLTLTFSHVADPNLSYTVETTNDLQAGWTPLHEYGSFAIAGTITHIADDLPVGDTSSSFLRLTVTTED